MLSIYAISILLLTVVTAIYLVMRYRTDIQMMQQNSYRNDRYLRWYAIKVFERDDKVMEGLQLTAELKAHLEQHIADCEKELDDDAESIITNQRYAYINKVVEKAVKMAEMMDIPIVGVVENMSYVTCPDCGREIHVFGESHIDEVAAKYALPVLGKLPMEPKLAAACDRGAIELFEGGWLDGAADLIESLPQREL